MMIPLMIIIAMCFIHLNTALIMIVTAPFIPLFILFLDLKHVMNQRSNDVFKSV